MSLELDFDAFFRSGSVSEITAVTDLCVVFIRVIIHARMLSVLKVPSFVGCAVCSVSDSRLQNVSLCLVGFTSDHFTSNVVQVAANLLRSTQSPTLSGM